MCGRYSVYVGDDPGIREIIEQVQKLHPEVKTGEVFPTDLAPVLILGITAVTWPPQCRGDSRHGKANG